MSTSTYQVRTSKLREKLRQESISLALIEDPDSVYYFTGYYNYLHMDFGRPTILIVSHSNDSIIITPSMELEMAGRMTCFQDIRPWQDGVGDEWRGLLAGIIEQSYGQRIGVERSGLPPAVTELVRKLTKSNESTDITSLIAELRMVKQPDEIKLARHAGEVGVAMMTAAHQAISEGAPEYEAAIAAASAGTRKAAALLEEHYADEFMSPNVHFLQIMASGSNVTMPHHRASTRRLGHGDPVFFCFCGMTNFHNFKLGFDRMFWLGEVGNAKQEKMYHVAVESQAAALKMIRPGVTAEEVHGSYAEVIQSAGYEFPFRCGRATGFSFLEKPQLTLGDKTKLQSGMVLAVDGSVNEPGVFRAQVGDTILVTDAGYEFLTEYPKELSDVVVSKANRASL
jgi:Xaa-Pro dipeptidase